MKIPVKPPSRSSFPSPLIFHLNASIKALLSDTAKTGATNSIHQLQFAAAKLATMLNGLEAWQNHPVKRILRAPPVISQLGSAKLLDFGQIPEAIHPNGPPVLVLPSLINKSYILDLSAENSFLRTLAKNGLRPILLDWGPPNVEEAGFDINAYITKRALPALNEIEASCAKPVAIVGYCMGGTIAAAISQIHPKTASLVTIGAPWDFSKATGNQLLLQNAGAIDDGKPLGKVLTDLGNIFGAIPFEFMQYLFAALDSEKFLSKFEGFAALEPSSKAAEKFTLVEDWLADGSPISMPTAKNLLLDWHVKNQISDGKWRLHNQSICAGKIKVPSMVICGKTDNIAPLSSTMPLAEGILNSEILCPDTGHVGMIVGSNAPKTIIHPIVKFLLNHGKTS